MRNVAPFIVFFAHKAIVQVNHHNCYQMIVSLKNTFSTSIGDERMQDLKGLLINKGIKHSCNVIDSSVVVYYIDSDSLQGRFLDKIMENRPFVKIEDIAGKNAIEDLFSLGSKAISYPLINDFAKRSLQTLLPVDKLPCPLDDRIEKIINYIDKNINRNITLKELAELAYLSPERLRHLFSEQTGTSFSQFIIWERIKKIIDEVTINGMSMANAAAKYGFTDQPHFSKLFKRMFGVPAKTMLTVNPYIRFLNVD